MEKLFVIQITFVTLKNTNTKDKVFVLVFSVSDYLAILIINILWLFLHESLQYPVKERVRLHFFLSVEALWILKLNFCSNCVKHKQLKKQLVIQHFEELLPRSKLQFCMFSNKY